MIEKTGSCSETGLKRKMNQDMALALYHKDAGLFLVADGMGGHYRGELASGKIAERLKSWWLGIEKCILAMSFQDTVTSLEKEIQKANTDIYNMYKEMNTQGGSTLCVLLICGNFYAVFYVGDSHIYCCNGRTFEKMMKDDVWENQKHIRDMADVSELKKNSHYGRLTLAVGIQKKIQLQIRTGQIRKKNCFFLCSDGVYKYCDEKILKKSMKKMLRHGNVEREMEGIKKKVYEKGAGDNLSMVVVLAEK